MNGLTDIAHIILHSMAGFVPAVLLYSCIAMAVIRAKISNENAKPAEFYPNRHIYHPQRVFTFYKVVVYVATVIFLCFLLPYISMFISIYIFGHVAMPLAAIIFVIGVVLAIKIIKRPDGSVIESLIVDSAVLTVKYRGGGTETYECRKFVRYNNAGASGTMIVFRDENGAETSLRIGSLTDWDNNTLKADLERVCQTGNIATIKKTSAGTIASGTATQTVQNTQAQQAAQKKREEYYADPQRYAVHLKEEAAKLSAEQRQNLVSMIVAGEIINAIKRCREWTHLGLKEAKDMVDSYRTCLMDSDMSGMVTITAAAAQPVMPAEIPTAEQPIMPAEIPAAAQPVMPVEIPTATPTQAVIPAEIPAFTTDVTSSFMTQMPSVPSSISGFGFDMPGMSHNNSSWTLRITDNEQPVTDERSLERTIDSALSAIGRKKGQSLFLCDTPAAYLAA